LPRLRKVSGEAAVKILCNKFGFEISGRSGSHVRLSKVTPEGKVGTVVPMHRELKIGTLKGVLKLAKIDPREFLKTTQKLRTT
jgi:predicted RNA binding protein YcfA (HicA-like mRNA interferase family)